MSDPSDQLDLLSWRPPCKIIPFPARCRRGHAKKVAYQLAAARSQREANHILRRACATLLRQMHSAGFHENMMIWEERDFLIAIYAQCDRIGSSWTPIIPYLSAKETPKEPA